MRNILRLLVLLSLVVTVRTAMASGVSFNDTDNKPVSSVSPSFSGTSSFSGNVGIGTTTPQGSLVVTNGNVGIGTWVPKAALIVQKGNVGIGDTTTALTPDTNLVVYAAGATLGGSGKYVAAFADSTGAKGP